MFTKFRILVAFTIIAVQNSGLAASQQGSNDLQQGFTTRCDELCSSEIQEVKDSFYYCIAAHTYICTDNGYMGSINNLIFSSI